jgi:hypothetical protein
MSLLSNPQIAWLIEMIQNSTTAKLVVGALLLVVVFFVTRGIVRWFERHDLISASIFALTLTTVLAVGVSLFSNSQIAWLVEAIQHSAAAKLLVGALLLVIVFFLTRGIVRWFKRHDLKSAGIFALTLTSAACVGLSLLSTPQIAALIEAIQHSMTAKLLVVALLCAAVFFVSRGIARWSKRDDSVSASIFVVALTIGAVIGVRVFLSSQSWKVVQVENVIRNASYIQDPKVMWEGETVVIYGKVSNEETFAFLSHSLAQVVGAGYVVNETTLAPASRPVAPDERVALVSISVNSRYDDSPESLQQIAAILGLPQRQAITVQPGATLSSVILQQYGVGASDLPSSYRLLANKIEEINDLRDPDHLVPGTLELPILPPRAAQQPAAVIAPRSGFSVWSYSGELNGALGDVGYLSPEWTQKAVVPPGGEQSERAISVLSVPVSRSQLSETAKALQNMSFVVTSGRMIVRFADSNAPTAGGTHLSLTAQDRSQLVAALQMQTQRNATVFVLDDGWPDANTYAQSVVALQEISDTIRSHYNLPRVLLPTSPFVPLPSPTPHSAYIRDSIREFTDVDTAHHVKVIYVPLSKAQNSSPVLRELLELYFIVRSAKSATDVTDTSLKAADSYATTVLAGMLDLPDETQMATDEGVLQALWSVGDFAARNGRTNDVFFINESWTVAPGVLQDDHPGVTAGIAVVAAGNAPSKVVDSGIEGVDFARECASTKSVLAVLNVQPPKGIICNSSIVRTDLLDDTFVVGFDGEVIAGPNESACLDGDVKSCVCGTSFAAPRVAWMLALHEEIQPADIDYVTWNALLMKNMRGLRTQDTVPWSGLYLRPSDMLKP